MVDGLDAFLAPWTDHPPQLRELYLRVEELRRLLAVAQDDLDRLTADATDDPDLD